MTNVHQEAVETWNTLFERDLDALIRGDVPLNDDLHPLLAFLDRLEQFGTANVDPEVIRSHAESSGAHVRARRSNTSTPVATAAEHRLPWRARLRNRATAFATTVLMVGGMTGVAWAADGAAPGDLLYGIDRALEAVGIWAGGSAERLEELTSSGMEAEPQLGGHDPAVAAVDHGYQIGNEKVPAGATAIHSYLETADGTDGLTVAEIAKQVAERNLIDNGVPPHAGKPEDAGKPEHAGKPEDAGTPQNQGIPGNSKKP